MSEQKQTKKWVLAGQTFEVQPGYVWENLTAGIGAAIEVRTSGTVTGGGSAEEAARFVNNYANGSAGKAGGAIDVGAGASVLTLSHVEFTSNGTAGDGGAIQTHNGATATITDVVFSGNYASGVGGAICNATGANLTIGDVVFNNNVQGNTTYKGGAIYNATSPITVTGKITLCTQNDTIQTWGNFNIDVDAFGGGAYYLVVDDQVEGTHDALFDSSYFRSNDTGKYVTSSYHNDLYIKSTTASFTSAVISSDGSVSSGTIAGIGVGGVAYDYDQIQLAKNWGATSIAYMDGVPVISSRQDILASQAFYAKGGTVSGVSSVTEGGAFYVRGTLALEGVTFSGNTAQCGAAIGTINAATANVTVTDSLFTGNSATNGGGAVHTRSGANVTITDTTFRNNHSDSIGGAIYNRTGANLTIGNVIFDNNVQENTTYQGGAIYNETTAVTVTGKITLCTQNDTIQTWANFNIDVDSFDGGAYYLVVDDQVEGAHDALYSSSYFKSNDTSKYTTYGYNNDLYIKSTDTTRFATAVFSTDGSVTSAAIAGEVVSGLAYDYDQIQLAKNWGATTVVYANGIQAAQQSVAAGQSLYASGGTISGTNGVALTNRGTTVLEGVTFAGNSATNGGGIFNATGANLTLDDVTFNGNTATNLGGAIYNETTAVTVKGKITLCTATDTIQTWGNFNIDVDAFGDGAYHLVVDDQVEGAHTALYGSGYFKSNDTSKYTTYGYNNDLYLKSTTASFTNAVISSDGSVSSGTIAGIAVSGVAYDYDQIQLAKNWGATSIAYMDGVPVISSRQEILASQAFYAKGGTVSGVSSVTEGGALYVLGTLALEDVTFSGNTAQRGAAIGTGPVSTANVTVTDSLFSGNSTTGDGGAVATRSGATVSITNTTFRNNHANGVGGAICNAAGANLTIGNVVFDNNVAENTTYKSGAIFNETSSVKVTGSITLCTQNDTIQTWGNFLIDGSAFDFTDSGYQVVVDAAVSGLYNKASFVLDDDSKAGYTLASSGNNLYIRDNSADLSSAVITADGSATSVTINGVEYSGTAYSLEHADLSKTFGASSAFYSGITQNSALHLAAGSADGDAAVGLKDSTVTGNVYGYNYVGDVTKKISGTISGNLTVQMENVTIGRLYAAGTEKVSGTITTNVVNSTMDVISTTAATDFTAAAMVTNLTDTTVTTEVRGTGSASSVTVGSATINLAGTNTLGKITGCYGNTVTGSVALNVTSGVSTVSGAITNVDTITVAAGAELVVGNTVTVTTSLTNNGTFTWDCTKSGNAPTVSDWSKVTNNGTLTASIAADAFGTYVLANNAADFSDTITVKNGSETIAALSSGYLASGDYFLGLNKDANNTLTLSVASAIVNITADGNTISWDAVTGAPKYLVSYSENDGAAWTTVETADTEYTYTGSASDVQFKVQVSDGTNVGNASVLLSASVDLKTAAENAQDGDKIQLAAGNYEPASAITVGANNVALIGQGADSTTVAKAIYGAGNAVTVKDLTASTNVAGGAANTGADSTALAVESAHLKDAFAGSLVKSGDVTVTSAAAIVNGTYFQNLYGAGYATGSGVKLNAATVDLTVNGDSTSGSIFGAGRAANGAALTITDAVTVTVDNGITNTLSSLYAGGYANGGSTLTLKDVNTTITSGKFNKFVAAGSQVYGSGTTGTAESANLTVTGGIFSNAVLGASYAAGGAIASVTAATTEISGGSFTGYVAGGGYANGGSTTVGSVNLTVTGGTFNKYLFGGNLCSNAAGTATEVTGQVHLTLDASSNKISAQSIYAGSLNKYQDGTETLLSNTVGSTLVELKGDGSNLSFVRLYGSNANPDLESTETPKTNGVLGDKQLFFNGFSGTLSGKIYQFDTFTMTDSTVEFDQAQALANVSSWNLTLTDAVTEEDALIDWSEGGSNSFASDTMKLTFDTDSTTDLLVVLGDTKTKTVEEQKVFDLDLSTSGLASVTLNGAVAEKQTNGSWMATVEGVDWYLKNVTVIDEENGSTNNLVLSKTALA